jgi:hypothetical protein
MMPTTSTCSGHPLNTYIRTNLSSDALVQSIMAGSKLIVYGRYNLGITAYKYF